MHKKIILIFSILLMSFAFADEPIKAGIKYNEATARIAAFKDIQKKVDRKIIKDYLKDPNKKENIEAIKNKQYSKNYRELCPFFIKNTLVSYAVYNYAEKENMVFYYDIFGRLIKFDIVEENDEYSRTMGYTKYGNLISVSFSAEDNEQFVYDENGELTAHWLEGQMVDDKSKFFKITRKANGIEETEEETDANKKKKDKNKTKENIPDLEGF